jgi:alpha-D-ribose 1-methylphosphonate 5-triphosphate synthase subunit PhnI
MYVAVKGGERAIENAHRLLAHERRGDPNVPDLSLDQISEQLALAVDRVMTEGSLYDRELAALAIKQARGDLIEAIFLAGASPPLSRTFRAARFSGRPSTTRTVCLIPRSPAKPRRKRRPRRR